MRLRQDLDELRVHGTSNIRRGAVHTIEFEFNATQEVLFVSYQVQTYLNEYLSNRIVLLCYCCLLYCQLLMQQ